MNRVQHSTYEFINLSSIINYICLHSYRVECTYNIISPHLKALALLTRRSYILKAWLGRSSWILRNVNLLWSCSLIFRCPFWVTCLLQDYQKIQKIFLFCVHHSFLISWFDNSVFAPMLCCIYIYMYNGVLQRSIWWPSWRPPWTAWWWHNRPGHGFLPTINSLFWIDRTSNDQNERESDLQEFMCTHWTYVNEK